MSGHSLKLCGGDLSIWNASGHGLVGTSVYGMLQGMHWWGPQYKEHFRACICGDLTLGHTLVGTSVHGMLQGVHWWGPQFKEHFSACICGDLTSGHTLVGTSVFSGGTQYNKHDTH